MSDRYTDVTAGPSGIGEWGHIKPDEAIACCREHFERERRVADEVLAALDAGDVTVHHQLGPYAMRNRRQVWPEPESERRRIMTATLDRKTFREAVYYRGKAQTVDEAGRLLHALHGGDVGPWHLCARPTCAVLEGLGGVIRAEHDAKVAELEETIADLHEYIGQLERKLESQKGKKK